MNQNQLQVLRGFYLPREAWDDPVLQHDNISGHLVIASLAQPPIRCTYNTCQGGTSFDALCKNGSTGVLCGTCNHSFYRFDHECKECPEGNGPLALTVCLTTLAVLLLLSSVFVYLRHVARAAAPPLHLAASEGDEAKDSERRSAATSAAAPPKAQMSARLTQNAPGYAPSRGAGGVCRSCARGLLTFLRRLLPERWPQRVATVLKILIAYAQMLDVFLRIPSIHCERARDSNGYRPRHRGRPRHGAEMTHAI